MHSWKVVGAGLSAAVLAAGTGYPASAMAQEVISYTYDGRGRVVQVGHSGSANAGVSSSYSYDKADNRTNVTVTGAASGMAAPVMEPEAASPDAAASEATTDPATDSDPAATGVPVEPQSAEPETTPEI